MWKWFALGSAFFAALTAIPGNWRSRRTFQPGDGDSHHRHFGFGVGTCVCARRKLGLEFDFALDAVVFGVVGRGNAVVVGLLLPRASRWPGFPPGATRQVVAAAHYRFSRAVSGRKIDLEKRRRHRFDSDRHLLLPTPSKPYEDPRPLAHPQA